jgi:cell division transport system permease protein
MRSFGFFLKETLDGIRHHPTGSLVTFGQVFVSLFFLSICLIIIININQFVGRFLNNLEMGAFLNDAVSYDDAVTLMDVVRHLPGVRDVTYVSKEEAFADMQELTAIDISDLVNENPLPASLKITVSSPRAAEELADSIAQLGGVDDVRYGKEQLQSILPVFYFFELLSFYSAVFLTWFSLLIIANTIRLAILSRHKEIRIMQLVGASGWFIRLPFLLEGLVYGIGGAATALIIVSIGYNFLLSFFNERYIFVPLLIKSNIMVGNLAVMIFSLGILIGVIASLVAVDKHLKDEVYTPPIPLEGIST